MQEEVVDRQATLLEDFRQRTPAPGNQVYTLQQALAATTAVTTAGTSSTTSSVSNNPNTDSIASSSNNNDRNADESLVSALATPSLSCQAHGGPDDNAPVLSSMVYWKDIPADHTYESPHRQQQQQNQKEQYLTFEPDEAGFNNQRMAFETTIGLTGRTVVLPPKVGIANLRKGRAQQSFGFADFFDLDALQAAGVKMMEFEDFLQTVALSGNLIDYHTGQATFPPGNRTNWDSVKVSRRVFRNAADRAVWDWLRASTRVLDWDARNCVAAIPTYPGPEGVAALQQAVSQVAHDDAVRFANDSTGARDEWVARWKSIRGHPTPANGSTKDRLAEILGDRKGVCIYDESYQQTQVLHIKGEEKSGSRLLVHYYAFLFPQHWSDNLRMLRLIRDQLRYKNEIQCAAARIVEALRNEQQPPQLSDAAGEGLQETGFYSMHVRRGDFQHAYPAVYLNIDDMYTKNLRLFFSEGRTVYIATDEKNKAFFDLLRKHYKIKFLSDYEHLLTDIDPAYYGMIEQLVTAAGSRFFGTYYSTFSGFILRLRGFYSQRDHAEGWQEGTLDSYYLCDSNPCAHRRVMQREYLGVKPGYWEQEFPVAWRDLDYNVIVKDGDPGGKAAAAGL